MPTTIYQNLKTLLLIQVLIGVGLGLILAYFAGLQLGASFAVGAGLMTGNLALLAWSTWRLIAKKSIAWTVTIIVFKYGILLGSVVYFAQASWFNTLGVGLGVSSFVLAALLAAMIQKKEKIEIGSSSF